MLIPDHATLELHVPHDPEWLTNDCEHTLVEIDLGQFFVTVYKATDRAIHVRLIDDIRRRSVKAELLIEYTENDRTMLLISWSEEAVSLQIESGLPVRLPWRASPLSASL